MFSVQPHYQKACFLLLRWSVGEQYLVACPFLLLLIQLVSTSQRELKAVHTFSTVTAAVDPGLNHQQLKPLPT